MSVGENVQQLLPGSRETLACSVFDSQLAVDPAGTGLFLDRLVLLEVAEPWPKPALKHEVGRLAAVAFATHRVRRSRVLLCVPSEDLNGDETVAATVIVHVYDRVGVTATYQRFSFARNTFAQDIQQVAHIGIGERLDSCVVFEQVAAPAILVCVQGSHDVCCGSFGVSFANALMADRRFSSTHIFQVSHVGGHRFAPTCMTFPDGRMWAHSSIADMTSWLEKESRLSSDTATRCRGWWGMKTGFAQVAERAVFAEQGWAFDQSSRSGEVTRLSESSARCIVSANQEKWEVLMEVCRVVPVISCGTPGGQPVKPAAEYRVKSVQKVQML